MSSCDDLISRAQAGDKDAREQLVIEWRPFVYAHAARHVSASVPLEDLRQEGTIALLAALRRYNPARGSFANFASLFIRRALYWYATKGESFAHRWESGIPENHPAEDGPDFSFPDGPDGGIDFSVLSDLEADIVRRRFGFGGQEYTSAQIASSLGYSKSQINRILAQALARLRLHLESERVL